MLPPRHQHFSAFYYYWLWSVQIKKDLDNRGCFFFLEIHQQRLKVMYLYCSTDILYIHVRCNSRRCHYLSLLLRSGILEYVIYSPCLWQYYCKAEIVPNCNQAGSKLCVNKSVNILCTQSVVYAHVTQDICYTFYNSFVLFIEGVEVDAYVQYSRAKDKEVVEIWTRKSHNTTSQTQTNKQTNKQHTLYFTDFGKTVISLQNMEICTVKLTFINFWV